MPNFACRSAIIATSFFSIFLCGHAYAAKTVHMYVFFGMDRERIAEPTFLETKAIEGAQLKYTWKQLEHEKNNYDFSSIHHDLEFLQSKGKKLFIQLQDVSFDASIKPFPKYLLNDPDYHGGAVQQFDIKQDDEAHATPGGWVARRWDPAVQARWQKLIGALGKEFDGKIEGINLPETAVDFGDTGRLYPPGFTPIIYRDAIVSNMAALKHAFPESIAMQYANFMPEERGDTTNINLRAIYLKAAELNIACGGPDLLPYKPGQMNNSYPLLRESAGRIPTGIAVQDGNYAYINPKTGRQITVAELMDFSRQYLKIDYVFWCTEEPYYSHDVIPFLQSQ